MTDPGQLPGRRYNEKEVADIIKRASEFQQLESTAESTAGMSLTELEQVAREAGLDPALVRRAATDIDTRVSDQKPSAFIGAPTNLVLERTIDGEVPVDEYETLVLEMQRELGGVGQASMLGRSLVWTMQGVTAAKRVDADRAGDGDAAERPHDDPDGRTARSARRRSVRRPHGRAWRWLIGVSRWGSAWACSTRPRSPWD